MNFDEERALATVAHEAIVEMRRKRRWKIFFRIFWALYWLLLLSFLFGLKGSDPKSEGASYRGKHLAVVSVQGMIASDMEANADDIISGLEKAFKNPMAEAVILDINSGGGSPVQSGAVYRAVKRLKSERSDLPVYAVIADVGASGAYYIAASADEIYAGKHRRLHRRHQLRPWLPRPARQTRPGRARLYRGRTQKLPRRRQTARPERSRAHAGTLGQHARPIH